MMRRVGMPVLAASLVVCLASGALAGDGAPAAATPAAKPAAVAGSYVGSAKCKMCHNTPAKGEQWKIWSGTKHAQAFAVLATPAAADIAKKAGVTGNPQEAAQCLACHTTGAAAKAELRTAMKREEGVSCEAC